MNDLQNLKYQCLRLAISETQAPGDAVARARKYADFVLGTNDAEIVRAASELASKVAGDAPIDHKGVE